MGDKPRTGIGRLYRTAMDAPDTFDHVERALSAFDATLVEFNKTLERFADVLVQFGETVGRVDTAVDRISVITDELGEIVGEMGGMVQTFSPAFALNEGFRRQLERIRRRPAESEST